MPNHGYSPRELKQLTVLGLSAVALTLLTGVVYGRWTQRWGAPPDARVAAKRVELPRQIGDWRLLEENTMPEEVIRTLECVGYVNRVYVNQANGEKVSVAVIVGPPGPISVHTPEICYSSRAFEISGSRQKTLFNPAVGSTHSLWGTTFKSRNAGAEELRVYYGWSTGDAWQASPSPRFEFGGSPFLYKIQIAALVDVAQDGDARDPSQEFMDALLANFWHSSRS